MTQTKTKQEAFDQVVDHLFAQGGPAKRGRGGQCRYRDQQTGRKCAFGVVIPDELYDTTMEDRAVRSVLNKFPALEYLREHKDLYAALQQAHDLAHENGLRWVNAYGFSGSNPRGIAVRLAFIANEFGLKFNAAKFGAYR